MQNFIKENYNALIIKDNNNTKEYSFSKDQEPSNEYSYVLLKDISEDLLNTVCGSIMNYCIKSTSSTNFTINYINLSAFSKSELDFKLCLSYYSFNESSTEIMLTSFLKSIHFDDRIIKNIKTAIENKVEYTSYGYSSLNNNDFIFCSIIFN